MVESGAISQAIQYSQKRLTRTITHVLKHWMPVNVRLVDKIRDGLDRGAYDKNRDALVSDLQSDFSLYTWCLRRLCQTAEEEDRAEFDPIRGLEEIDLNELRQLLNIDDYSISSHELDNSDDEQVRVLREVMLGASAAKLVTDKLKGDSRAYGVSLLRQLGLTLIAWNYPIVFEGAMEKVREGGDLDVELSKKIGFSPGLLAMKIVRSWGISERKCLSLGLMMPSQLEEYTMPEDGEISDETSAQYDKAEKHGSFLRAVCDLGEKLAKVNDPETYPGQASEWDEVESEVKRVLGSNGITKVREHFEENCSQYAALIPDVVESDGHIFDRDRFPDSRKSKDIQRRNKYLDSCLVDVKLSLKKMYSHLDATTGVDRAVLQIIIRDSVPTAGFQGGAIFTFDPTIAKLVPQLNFGEIQGIELEAVDYSEQLSRAEFIAEAYQRVEPITARHKTEDGDWILRIAGPLGKLRRLGVLYLEIPPMNHNGDEQQIIDHAKAIARAFADCLRV